MTKAQQHEALIAEYRKTMDKEVLHCWAKDACTAMALLHARVQELEAQLSARQDGMEPLAWRKRADEIELQVAKSGSTEAMRCFTDMRTLLQAATAPQATQPPCAWAISYDDGKTPYTLWHEGDGALLDTEIKRLGGSACKMPIYTIQPQAPAAPAVDAEIAKKVARYEWLARKVSAHGVCDGWAFGFPSHLTLPAPALAMRDPEAALGQALDAAISAQAKEGGAA